MSAAPTGLLGQTLATDFVVGSNASGTANGNWPFLLPALRAGTVLCCGTPTLAALRTLAGIARDVMVCPPSRPNRSAVLRARAEGLTNVGTREISTLEASSIDVAWLGTRSSPTLLDTLDRLLKPGGLLFSEEPRSLPRSSWPARAEFWTAPRGHDVQLAVPARNLPVIEWARRGGLAEATRGRLARRVSRRLPRAARVQPWITRHTALLARDGTPRHSLPAYVLEIAQASGVPLEDRPWAFWAPGRYASKKILFFAFDRAGTRPEIVVRLTRNAALNYRLENEWRALRQLEESGVPDAETVPQPRFFGYHEGLAVLGETAVDGVPFAQRSSARDDCPYGRAAVEWLVDLGVRTADNRSFGPGEIADAVSAIHDRFTRTYTLSAEHRRVLAFHVEALGSGACAMPTVRQHGDPGTWNLLVTPTGRVAVLDWEAYEQHGMPLWDLFYFMRSYGVWASRVTGTRDPLDGYARQFFADSPMNHLLTGAVARFGDRTDLAGELVEPLFFTCWMHRAVKESTRLEPQRLESGHFVRLLRRCLDERRSSGLRRLFAAGD
ncbi:MAG: phosphotransferase family protein [Egibacteraceae bacterium]